MSNVKEIEKVKLFTGLLTSFEDLFEDIESTLENEFGVIDLKSELIPFDFTDYYEKKMGENLLRRFYSFQKLILPDEIAKIKLKTNEIELEFSEKYKSKGVERVINLDPGYIASSKLILASTKDYYHRIYLSDGIFAEVTLHFQKGKFREFDWTYPDYRTEVYKEFFKVVREKYLGRRE